MMRRYIRRLAVWLRAKTDAWVTPAYIARMVEHGDYAGALQALEKAGKLWGEHDPEIVRYRALIAFLSDD